MTREHDDEAAFEPNRRKQLAANKQNSFKGKKSFATAQVSKRHPKRGRR